jgi:RNA polymerase sigma-54 factor
MFFRFNPEELTLNDARSSRTSMTLTSELGKMAVRIDGRDTSCTINLTSEDDIKRLRDFIDDYLKTFPQKTYSKKGMGVTLFDANGKIDIETDVKLNDFHPESYTYRQLCRLYQQTAVYALYNLYEGIGDDKVEKIIEHCIMGQIKFVLTGDPSFSKKMTLDDVAKALDINNTTVSRCTQGVCIYSPCGKVFTLDNNTCSLEKPSLFDEGIKWNGSLVSRLEVLETIQRLVENEDKSNPLSDDELSARLVEMGYEISRRTVAKYRGFLGLENSNKRRR